MQMDRRTDITKLLEIFANSPRKHSHSKSRFYLPLHSFKNYIHIMLLSFSRSSSFVLDRAKILYVCFMYHINIQYDTILPCVVINRLVKDTKY